MRRRINKKKKIGRHVLDLGRPLILSYGMGIDSTAALVGWAALGIRPEMILFADVGDEKPETYSYLNTINAWLERQQFPQVRVLHYRPRRFKCGPYTTLFGNCWQNHTLPSLAFGRKACSNKWKIAVMDRFVRIAYSMHLAGGGQVLRAIGYDAGPKDSRRGGNITNSSEFCYYYPLRDWGWDRGRCKKEISEAGLPIPCKSACFFCPSTQKHELTELCLAHPDLVALAIAMEDRARPYLKKVEGLWRTAIKGTRKPESKRPGDWRSYVEELGYMHRLPRVTRSMIAARL